MKKHTRLFLWFLTILTLLAVGIILSNNIPVRFTIPKFPGMKRALPISFVIPSRPLAQMPIIQSNKDFSFKQGLDLSGGTSITLRADMSKVAIANRDNGLEAAKTVIERRINLFGVSEPVIETSKANNDYRVIVELPGVDSTQAINLIGTTAQLTFWEGLATTSANYATPSGMPLGMGRIFKYPHQTSLTGNDLKNVAVSFDSKTGQPQVQLQFAGSGSEKFADITKRNTGKIVAIALDNQIIQAPVVNEPILTGDAVISGGFTQNQANAVSIQLRGGSLPIPLKVLEQSEIGATLGSQYLTQMVFAGSIGFIIIMVFMMVLYGRLGAIASVALIIYTLLALAVFKSIPVTLTLAGMAGFVLSIGMAVDANILIFERTKEEIRDGKSEHMAIELGFKRAWSSIRDSNISTLITSFVLYEFGNGIVRGFAVTLALGVLVSMFSAIVVTRNLIRVFYHIKIKAK